MLKDPDVVNSSSNAIYNSSLFGSKFHYLQAGRSGLRRFFETSDFLVRQQRQLGSAGEYTAQFLEMFGKENIGNSIPGHRAAASNTLQDQVEAWLGEISPGIRISLASQPGTDEVSLQSSFVTGSKISNTYRATNVGFGIMYVLPIVVAVLSSAPGSLLLIENPEAYVTSPRIDRNGRIDRWPDGFFDEWDKSLETLLMRRYERDMLY